MQGRASSRVVVAQVALTVGALAVAALYVRADVAADPQLAVLLLALCIGAHAFPLPAGPVQVSGSFMGLVLAMLLLGPGAAACIGVLAVLVDWPRSRTAPRDLLSDLAAYATFPLAGGLLAGAVGAGALTGLDGLAAGVGVYMTANVLNFVLIVAPKLGLSGGSLATAFRALYVPVAPWQLAGGVATAIIAQVEVLVGASAIVALGLLLLLFHHLLRSVLVAERRMEDLVAMHEGLVAILLRTLSLRDPMTARHSAAVARYARAIASEAGCDARTQELVHAAGLLHDIGKMRFPDAILLAEGGLTDDQFRAIQAHPEAGARIVRRVPGLAGVADLVVAHHERIDGRGYPARLAGEAIPEGARILAVADTYDVLTARDSYRRPVSQDEAIAELRRVAGTQLDARFVAAFERVLGDQAIAFGHADDEDLEAELRAGRFSGRALALT